jgi:hypothetical protein
VKNYLIALSCALGDVTAFAADPLPSWNDTAPKQAIVPFVDLPLC